MDSVNDDQLHIDIPSGLKQELKAAAAAADLTLAQYVRAALRDRVQRTAAANGGAEGDKK